MNALTATTAPAPLTEEQFKAALPEKMKKSINKQLMDSINKTFSDPDMYETYRDNLLSYTRVMQDGKFRIDQYLNAVKYCSFKLMGKTNIDSFTLTFPAKIQRWTTQGIQGKDIASYVTAYNKSKLVNLIMEQSLVPTWVLNQDIFQQAINTQAELMMFAKSEKVRSDAANSLLSHLKAPETNKIELEVSVKEDSAIAGLRRVTSELVAAQREALRAGTVSVQEMAEQDLIIEGEAEEIDP